MIFFVNKYSSSCYTLIYKKKSEENNFDELGLAIYTIDENLTFFGLNCSKNSQTPAFLQRMNFRIVLKRHFIAEKNKAWLVFRKEKLP